MGWSAGAMMQCSQYYISPDKDYPEFIYEKRTKMYRQFCS